MTIDWEAELKAIATPHQADALLRKASGHLAFVYGEIERLEVLETQYFNQNRHNHKSDKACERAWGGTENGINLNGLKTREKLLKTITSYCKNYLRRAENEAFNNF